MTLYSRSTGRPVAWSMLVRQFHVYLSMLIAPSLLMFSLTGGLQIWRLQQGHPGYTPPPIVEKLGRVHIDAVYAMRPPRKAAPAPAGPARPPEAVPLKKQILKWFFTLVAAGLFASTVLGIWMGVTVSRWRIAARWLVGVGAILPIVVLLLP
ncbi:hypothetical protein BH09PSE1_BH09PSE1_11810 [soil metagenome]